MPKTRRCHHGAPGNLSSCHCAPGNQHASPLSSILWIMGTGGLNVTGNRNKCPRASGNVNSCHPCIWNPNTCSLSDSVIFKEFHDDCTDVCMQSLEKRFPSQRVNQVTIYHLRKRKKSKVLEPSQEAEGLEARTKARWRSPNVSPDKMMKPDRPKGPTGSDTAAVTTS